MSLNYFNRHASILGPLNLQREIEPEQISFDEENFDPADDKFNYFIPQKYSTMNQDIVGTSQSSTYTTFLQISEEKKYELSINENIHNKDKRMRLKSIARISLPQLDCQISEEKENKKYDRQSSSNLFKMNATSLSQSLLADNTRNAVISHPKIFHCADTYLLIDTARALYLLDFVSKKITTLINKKNPDYLTILSTFDELYCKETKIEAVKKRTFIFCVDKKESLYYFTLEEGYIENSQSEVILTKLVFTDLKDIKVMKINHPEEGNNTFSYLITVLRGNSLGFYLSEYANKTLAYFLFRFKALIASKKIYWSNFNLTTLTKNKNKKIFSFYSKVEKCSIVIVNGYDVIMSEFAFNSKISELKKKFQLKEGELNFDHSHNNFNDNNNEHEAWMTNEFTTKNNPIAKLRTRESISSKYPQIKGEGFSFENLSIYEIDYAHYTILFVRGKLHVITRDNLFVLDTSCDIKNSKIFSQVIKKDEFVNFLIYPEINYIFIACKKNLFKFRFFKKFKFFRETFEKMSELEDSPVSDEINGENYKGISNYKELISNIENKPMNFTFEEFDKFFKSKIEFLLHSMINLNMKQKSSFSSRNEKKLICKKCKVFYSDSKSDEDSEIEWRSFHFFECIIINYLKEMKNYEGPDFTSQSIKRLVKTTEQIILQIFKFLHEDTDYREYLIFISLILHLFDKLGILQFIKNILKILDILPPNRPEAKLALHLNKILLVEVSFFYFNLKVLYIKFHFDSGSANTAAHLLHSFKDSLQIFRKDNKLGNETQRANKSFNLGGEKTTIKIDKNLIDEKLLKYLADNLYLTASNISSSHSGFNNNSSTSLFSTTYNTTNNNLFNNEKEIEIKIFDKFLIYYIDIKSTLMKYDLKIGRSKEQNTCFFLEDIVSNFEDRFTENSINLCYVYFYSSFYLVKINKLSTAVAVLTRAYQIANKEENNNEEMTVSCLYNLGILYSALGAYSEGIHHFEQAHRLIVQKSMSTALLLKVLHTLSLAYMNRKSSRKSFVLIQQSISLINLNNEEEPNNELIKLHSYLNFIIDLIEYDFNTVKKSKNWSITDMVRNKELDLKKESLYLIEYVLDNGLDMSKQIFEIFSEGFIDVLDFLYNCTPDQLAILNADNNQREENIITANNDINVKDKLDSLAPTSNNNTTTTEVTHRDLNQSNIHTQNPKENNQLINLARDKIIDTIDLREEIEIKKPFLNSLSVTKQEILKHLNSNLFKRILILRDSKGVIDHFNLNYHPIHSRSLQKIIESIRANFLIKEISLSQMPNKQDDSDFNYALNSYLYGLARYLKRPNIKHMLTVEKFRKANLKLNSLNALTKHNESSACILNEKIGNTPINMHTASLSSKVTRKIKFSEFINIADKIEFDKLEANDFLYEIYTNFDDDYCRYLLENPQILLNFVFNETKLFSYHKKSRNSEKQNSRKNSYELSMLEESFEREDEKMLGGTDLSEKSIRKKSNAYNKFTVNLAKELLIDETSRVDLIEDNLNSSKETLLDNNKFSEKENKLTSTQDNKIKIPHSDFLSMKDLKVKISKLSLENQIKDHQVITSSKSDSEVKLEVSNVNIIKKLKSSINTRELFKTDRLSEAITPIEDNILRISLSSCNEELTQNFNHEGLIQEVSEDCDEPKEKTEMYNKQAVLVQDIEVRQRCQDSSETENCGLNYKEENKTRDNQIINPSPHHALLKFKERIVNKVSFVAGGARYSNLNSSSLEKKNEIKYHSGVTKNKDDPNKNESLISAAGKIKINKLPKNNFIINLLNDKRKQSANTINYTNEDTISNRKKFEFQKKNCNSFDNIHNADRNSHGFEKSVRNGWKESTRKLSRSLFKNDIDKISFNHIKNCLQVTANNEFHLEKQFNPAINQIENEKNIENLNENVKDNIPTITTEPREIINKTDVETSTPIYINSRYDEVMITEYLQRKNKNTQNDKKQLERQNSKINEDFSKLNVMEKLKITNRIMKPGKVDNLFGALYQTNIKRIFDKNPLKAMKTEENIDNGIKEDNDTALRYIEKVNEKCQKEVKEKSGESAMREVKCDCDKESLVNYEKDQCLSEKNNNLDNRNVQLISKSNEIVSESEREKNEYILNLSGNADLITHKAVISEISREGNDEDTKNRYKFYVAPSSKIGVNPTDFSVSKFPSSENSNRPKINKNINLMKKNQREEEVNNYSNNIKQLNSNLIESSKNSKSIVDYKILKTNPNSNIKDSKIKSSNLEEDLSPIKVSPKPETRSSASKATISMLSTEKQKNLKHFFTKLRISSIIFFSSLKNYDLTILNLLTCENLLLVLPSESEQKQIKNYSIKKDFLTDSDRFCYDLIQQFPNFNLRIKSIIFRLSYQQKLNEIEKKLKKISNNLNFFLEDKRVAEWLQIILAYGNYFSGRENKNASVFKLNTLNSLSEIKSNDNKKTLLHFVVEWILDQKKFYLLELEFNLAESTQENGLQNLKESCANLRKDFLNVVKLAESSKKITDENNLTKEFLKDFYQEANGKILLCDRSVNLLSSEFEKVCRYYGENPKELLYEQFIEIFAKFFSDAQVHIINYF